MNSLIFTGFELDKFINARGAATGDRTLNLKTSAMGTDWSTFAEYMKGRFRGCYDLRKWPAAAGGTNANYGWCYLNEKTNAPTKTTRGDSERGSYFTNYLFVNNGHYPGGVTLNLSSLSPSDGLSVAFKAKCSDLTYASPVFNTAGVGGIISYAQEDVDATKWTHILIQNNGQYRIFTSDTTSTYPYPIQTRQNVVGIVDQPLTSTLAENTWYDFRSLAYADGAGNLTIGVEINGEYRTHVVNTGKNGQPVRVCLFDVYTHQNNSNVTWDYDDLHIIDGVTDTLQTSLADKLDGVPLHTNASAYSGNTGWSAIGSEPDPLTAIKDGDGSTLAASKEIGDKLGIQGNTDFATMFPGLSDVYDNTIPIITVSCQNVRATTIANLEAKYAVSGELTTGIPYTVPFAEENRDIIITGDGGGNALQKSDLSASTTAIYLEQT